MDHITETEKRKSLNGFIYGANQYSLYKYPLSGLKVSIWLENNHIIASTYTDKEGVYHLENLPPGITEIEIEGVKHPLNNTARQVQTFHFMHPRHLYLLNSFKLS